MPEQVPEEQLRIIDRALWVDHGGGSLSALTGELPIWADDWAERIVDAVNTPPRARVITTDVELAGTVPDGSIVRSNAGTIACRFDYGAGVVFGDDRPFPWGSLDLPVTVLWTPENGDTQ